MIRRAGFAFLAASLLGAAPDRIGETEIARWPHNKPAALSLTFDDGSINQFRHAVPILDELGFPVTFFIITGDVLGSRYHAAFTGRDPRAIVRETAEVPTGKDNLFERASAIGHLGLKGALECHSRAGELYEDGKLEEAYRTIDEGYAKVRAGALTPRSEPGAEAGGDRLTWDQLRALARRGA